MKVPCSWSWKRRRTGINVLPRVYANVCPIAFHSSFSGESHLNACKKLFERSLDGKGCNEFMLVSGANGDPQVEMAERTALADLSLRATATLEPKKFCGDLFAGAAALQIAMAAMSVHSRGLDTLAPCLGYGSTKALFQLQKPILTE